MQPFFTSDTKLKKVKFTVAELRKIEGVAQILSLLHKFDVGPASKALTQISKLMSMIDDKNSIDFTGTDGMIQPSIFENIPTGSSKSHVDRAVVGDDAADVVERASIGDVVDDALVESVAEDVAERVAEGEKEDSSSAGFYEEPFDEDDVVKVDGVETVPPKAENEVGPAEGFGDLQPPE